MARSLSRCALSAAICIAMLSRVVQAQEAAAPPAAEAPPNTLAAIEAKIEAALGEVTSLQFTQSPLSDVARYIKERHEVQVQFDTSALDTAGVTLDTPVEIDVEGVTLRSALNLMLRSIELTYEIHNGVLLITTPEEADSHLVTRVYDVRHFLYEDDDLGRRVRDEDAIINLVTGHVQPTSWTDVGGIGAIEVIDRGLVVSQSWSTQQEVGQFLRALEKGYDQHRQNNISATIYVGPEDTSATQAVRRALQEPTSLQFKESPLSDIVNYIKERHNLQVQLDTAALDSAGISSDTPVTIDVEHIPLANAISLFLRSIESDSLVADEVLLITTPEEVDNRLSTRIYPVKDLHEAEERASARPEPQPQIAPTPTSTTPSVSGSLIGPASGGYFPHPGPQPSGHLCGGDGIVLIELVTSTIEATTWTEVGGTGAIDYAPEFHGLVISQTDDVHAQIEALFAQLRRVAAVQQATEEAAPTTDKSAELSLRPYYLKLGGGQAVKDIGAMEELIKRVVEPGVWNDPEGRNFIHVVDDALMIQTMNAVHEKIAGLLQQLQITNGGSGRAGGGGFGGGGGGVSNSGGENAKEATPPDAK